MDLQVYILLLSLCFFAGITVIAYSNHTCVSGIQGFLQEFLSAIYI